MKICYVFSNFHLLHITGQPGIVFKLVSQARKREEEVYLISNAPEQEQLYQGGINLFLIRGLGDFKTYFFNIFKIIKYLKTIKPDIIHVHGHLLIIFVWLINRFLNISLVCSTCETLDKKRVNAFYRRLITFCIIHSELTFVTSECIKSQLIKNKVSSDKIIIARVGLDEKFLKDSYSSMPDGDILYYGDSTKERGFDIIFRLAQKLPHLKFKILLRWKGKDCSWELEEMGKLSNVTICYYPYSENLEQIISKSKLVVLPYRWIGVRPPVSLLEPMALGKCVVTSTMEGNEELIKNWFNGLMINFDKLDGMVSGISVLIKDDKRRENIGQQAKRTIQRMYSLDEYDKILNEYNTIYKTKK